MIASIDYEAPISIMIMCNNVLCAQLVNLHPPCCAFRPYTKSPKKKKKKKSQEGAYKSYLVKSKFV